MTDKIALRKMRNGSEDALTWVIEKYSGYVSTIVWNILRNGMTISDVEEVTSEVFFALWTRVKETEIASLKSYLAGIARNKAKNKLREAGHEISLEDNMVILDCLDLCDMSAGEEIAETVCNTVHAMKEPEREILLRYYYFYQSIPTISKEMHINLSTVKTKLRRAREKIKEILLSQM